MTAEADQIREQADEILSRPEYQPVEPSLLDRGVDWLGRQVGDLVRWLVGRIPGFGGGSGALGFDPLGWILIIALIGLVAYLLTKMRWRRLERRRKPGVSRDVRHETSRRHWLELAAEAEAEGRWSEVVRYRYRATVAGLVERRELSGEPGATSGEHRRRLEEAETPDAEPFGRVADRFERVWYGGDDADAEAAAELAEADDELLRERR